MKNCFKIMGGLFILIFSFYCVGAEKNEEKTFNEIVKDYQNLTSARLFKIKEGSRPFLFSQNKKAPTVVMIHGLSDSPESMVEVSKLYYKLGFNVVTVLLRDHGLELPFRNEIRSVITFKNWQEDLDQVMKIAFLMSEKNKVSLAGFSLGGALALDAANRYEGKISTLAFIAPMWKMNHSWLSASTRFLKYIKHHFDKGIEETPYFYRDFSVNQISEAFLFTQYLNKTIFKKPSLKLKEVPKILFLTDADTTIKNNLALSLANNIEIPKENIVMYTNEIEDQIVLHRDLPMRLINATKNENPHLDDLLFKLENFLWIHH